MLRKAENKPTGVNYAQWQAAQLQCKRARAKMWRYGDPEDDEDEMY